VFTDLKNLTLSFKPRLWENVFVRINEIGVYMTFLRLSPQLRLTLRGNFSVRYKQKYWIKEVIPAGGSNISDHKL